MGGEIGVN